MIPLNWKFRLPPSHFGLFVPMNQQTKKGVTEPTRVLISQSRGSQVATTQEGLTESMSGMQKFP